MTDTTVGPREPKAVDAATPPKFVSEVIRDLELSEEERDLIRGGCINGTCWNSMGE
jgi:hypothetical protein